MQGLGQASALNNPLLNITMFAPVNSAFTAPLPSVCLLPYMPSVARAMLISSTVPTCTASTARASHCTDFMGRVASAAVLLLISQNWQIEAKLP